MFIKINFDDTYSEVSIAPDMSWMIFESEDEKRNLILLKVKIEPHPDPLLPGVFNLCFGTPDSTGEIDDKAKIRHYDANKMFSTILIFALAYLQTNPVTIGLDGSNDVRAYLYHRMFLTNRVYLEEYFDTIGVDWYVRLLRNRIDVERDADGYPYFKPKAEPFDYERPPSNLYRYYMFRLTKNK